MKQTSKQSSIIRKLLKAYKEIENEREWICAGCGANQKLSHSHTIARSRCKSIGKPELIYDKNNIEILCFDCHTIWEGLDDIKGKLRLKNFDKMLAFVELHDKERFVKLTA